MAVLAVGTSASSLREISLDPSALEWGLQDISASDAGRVQDSGNTMYKMRLSQKRKLNITWTMPTRAQASEILKAFNPEYFYVRYFDPMENALTCGSSTWATAPRPSSGSISWAARG